MSKPVIITTSMSVGVISLLLSNAVEELKELEDEEVMAKGRKGR
jgi:hypothetical protein